MTRLFYSPQVRGDSVRYHLFIDRVYAVLSNHISKFLAINPHIEDEFVIESAKRGGFVAELHGRIYFRAVFKKLKTGTILVTIKEE